MSCTPAMTWPDLREGLEVGLTEGEELLAVLKVLSHGDADLQIGCVPGGRAGVASSGFGGAGFRRP
jgi:hypothetical protein